MSDNGRGHHSTAELSEAGSEASIERAWVPAVQARIQRHGEMIGQIPKLRKTGGESGRLSCSKVANQMLLTSV